MKNKSAGVFAVLMIVLLACSCAPVTIRTAPDKAEVYNQGGQSQLGVTPYYTTIIKKEKFFTLRKDGYEENNVTVEADSPRYIDIRMARLEPTVLESQPPGAEVYDETGTRLLGKTPFVADAAEFDQNYKLKLSGFYEKAVQVTMESPASLVASMDPMPKKVTLNSTPTGAAVYLVGDRNPLGQTPMTTLVEEQTVYELKADKYYPATIILSSQSDPETSVTLKPMPYITIESEPTGAELYTEGSRGNNLGITPVTRLIEDPVSFELRKEGYDPTPFVLSSDAPPTVTIQLKEIPKVTIKSDPPGASLYRKGGVEFLGKTPTTEVVRQLTEFELHMKGYTPKSFQISGRDREVTIYLEGNETLLMERNL